MDTAIVNFLAAEACWHKTPAKQHHAAFVIIDCRSWWAVCIFCQAMLT